VTRLNSTAAYYRSGEDSLGWELTVSNALHPADSPCRKCLTKNASYGHLLYDHRTLFIPMGKIRNLLEIGGGYGHVMKDFLKIEWNNRLRRLMASPSLADGASGIIRHFLEDLYKYEYLILMSNK
jgi:hypothetical protein